jgi:hypothetical protein
MSDHTITYSDGNLLIILEKTCGYYFIHFDVKQFTPAVYKLMLKEINDVLLKVEDNVWAYYPTSKPEIGKLAKRFGFVKQAEIDGFAIELKEK